MEAARRSSAYRFGSEEDRQEILEQAQRAVDQEMFFRQPPVVKKEEPAPVVAAPAPVAERRIKASR
jgi:hypothetical protein